ncbi:MAG: mitochondrial fission ELM1 family protein [Gammaproteobacteria bacterium]|nr:mitochondrial fission ELM1 family protein [Gammaproteobacteria bacterium]
MSAHDQKAADAVGPSIWVLHSTGLGANRQLTNLAAALGGEYTVKDTLDLPWRAFIDRLTGSRATIPAAKSALLHAPWPDLVLFGGGRSWLDAVRIRQASGGHSRIVCIGRPGAPFDSVDLILTTPQYGLPRHPRIVHLDLPLNFVDPSRLAEVDPHWNERFGHLPRPWVGVLLGGDSGSYRFDVKAARRLGRSLAELCRRQGGAALLTSSPRTRPEVLDAVLAELEVPNFHYRFAADEGPNPLDAILALADALVVTADSASMLAEACSTGRPVAVFEPPLRRRARLFERSWLPSWPAGLWSRWADFQNHLTARGRWVPARRMERIHRSLTERGAIARVENFDPGTAAVAAGSDDLARAVAAILALLPRSGSDTDGSPVPPLDCSSSCR